MIEGALKLFLMCKEYEDEEKWQRGQVGRGNMATNKFGLTSAQGNTRCIDARCDHLLFYEWLKRDVK